MGITENLSPAGYLSTGVGPDVFALGEFEQLLRSIGYAVLDREHETDGRMVRLSVEKDGVRLGEISVRPDAGIYSSVPLDHSEIAQLAEWLRDRSNEEIWYWTSNGNECFRIDDQLANKLGQARVGGIGYPDGTPWEAAGDT